MIDHGYKPEWEHAVSEQLAEQTKDQVELTVDPRAAAINSLAQDIGAWADSKGFREEWEDADWLENLAKELSYDDDREFRLRNVDRLKKIAKSHRRMANVQKLMLMVSELSEALEGMRDGGNYGEELGDLVIRALENANKNGIPIGDEIIKKVAKNKDRPYKHGRQF